MKDWMEDLRTAHALGWTDVKHRPMTNRYSHRAINKLEHIIQHGVPIGTRAMTQKDYDFDDDSEVLSQHHLVIFAENDYGEFDYYTVFRVAYSKFEPLLEYGTLFCFYDGLDPYGDDPNNINIRGIEEAISYMSTNFPEYMRIKS